MSRTTASTLPVVPQTGIFSSVRPFLIFFITLFWFGLFAVMGIDTHHDGVMLAPAVTVAHGGVPFVDNFCQYGLLPPLLQGLAVWLFGEEVIVLRLLSLLFYGGIAVLLDKLSRRFLPGKWSWLTLLIFWLLVPDTMVTTHPWSSVFALFFMLWEVDLLIAFLSGGKTAHLWQSGICAFLAFASRHPCGIVTVIAALLTLALAAQSRERGKRLAWWGKSAELYLAGWGGAALPAALYLTWNGAWKDYFIQCWSFVLGFVWQRGGTGSLRQLGESFFPLVGQNYLLDALFSAFPLVALLMLWLMLRNADGNTKKWNDAMPFFALVLLGLGSWHQYYPVPCVRHTYWGAVPMMIVYVIALRRTLQTRKLLAGVLIFLLLPAAGVRLYAGTLRLKALSSRRQIDLPCVRGLYLNRREVAELTFWHDALLRLPQEMRRRGVVNLTQEAFWQNFYPQCAMRHPIPMRMNECPYPERDEQLFRFALANGCPILTDLEMEPPPGFELFAQGSCDLHYYRLFAPAE